MVHGILNELVKGHLFGIWIDDGTFVRGRTLDNQLLCMCFHQEKHEIISDYCSRLALDEPYYDILITGKASR